MGSAGDLHSTCNFFGRWSHVRWILPCQQRKWHRAIKNYAGFLSYGWHQPLTKANTPAWTRAGSQRGETIQGEGSSITSPAAAWSRQRTHLEHSAAWRWVLQLFLLKTTCHESGVTNLEKNICSDSHLPCERHSCLFELFWLQCWHFFRSAMSSAEEKTEMLFKTQIQSGSLGVQILTLHQKHDECFMLLLFFLF